MGSSTNSVMHLRKVRISSKRQLRKWRRYVREISSGCEYGRQQVEKSVLSLLKTAASKALLSATGIPGVEYSGMAAKILSGSWQSGLTCPAAQHSVSQSLCPASASSEVLYTAPALGAVIDPMNSRHSFAMSTRGT